MARIRRPSSGRGWGPSSGRGAGAGDRRSGLVAQGEPEREDRAHPRRARHREVASEQAGETPADREPEAGSTVLARVAAVHLPELLEDQLELVRGDADAGVRHGEGDVVTPTGDGHGDRPLVRELDGVAQEVEKDLLDLVLVGVEPRQVRIDRLHQAHLLALDQRLHRAEAEVNQRLEVEGHRADLDPAGLDLGEVEDVVDERQEVLGADEDLLEVLVLPGREDVAGAPHHEAAEPDDGVERGTELVGHAGEERRLVARGGLELVVQLLKLVGAHLDLDLQLLRVLADLLEQPAALDRDGGLVRQRRKKAPVVLPELRRCPALDQKDPDHRLPRLERHGDLGPDPGWPARRPGRGYPGTPPDSRERGRAPPSGRRAR